MSDWLKIDQKLRQAFDYRQVGYEGKARVAARLAVADAVHELYIFENEPLQPGSALDLLKDVTASWLFPSKYQRYLEHFTLRVNEGYQLPADVDLLSEAEIIVNWVKNHIDGERTMTENPTKIKIYATSWCGASRRARNVFRDNNIDYEWIDIEEDPEAAKFVESVNHGYRSVPTIVFLDGSILTEPSTAELMAKLGLKLAY